MQKNHPTYTQEQISAWFRGLMSIALADNDYSEQERTLFDQISHSDEWGEEVTISNFEPISAQDLADALGSDRKVGENFLRMAVMMALADGKYTDTEDCIIQEFCKALNQECIAGCFSIQALGLDSLLDAKSCIFPLCARLILYMINW